MTVMKKQIKPYPLGAHRESDSIRFSFASKSENCGILIYDRNTGKKIQKIPFLPEERMGNVYCKYWQNVNSDEISYQFYQDNTIVPDAHAKVFVGSRRYGKVREEKELKAAFLKECFEWDNDKHPKLSYEQSVVYCLHVRGFTKHSSSQVTHKGTYLGIVEKIPYLKESGITTIELQPAYEFLEIPGIEELKKQKPLYMVEDSQELLESQRKLNYWGYKKGFYYAPKASYASGEEASVEFKQMVKELHKNDMELIMQFYFPKEVNRGEIAEILRFWVLEYHVDGFHLMGENLPMDLIAGDETLVDTKLWYYHFDTSAIYEKDEMPAYRNLAEYRDDYLYTMRKFLKGDEDMLNSVLYQMRHIPEKAGRVHYMSNYYGFTLMDMVSYDYKHNEDNGEDNRDGNDYNCSWNCGEEGVTRKKKILSLRRKQLKNAMCLLLLTQSTPLIFMGDEFGNTQFGNNNPYCLDNKTTWLDWKELDKNRELYQFWQTMIKLRKAHPILRPEKELRIMDYIACGYPDLSYHGQNAWRPQTESYNRHIGLMYCGKYAKKDRVNDDDFFYVAMNMHWEPHELALPKLPKGMKWKALYNTADGFGEDVSGQKTNSEEEDFVRTIAERSIVIFISETDDNMVPDNGCVSAKKRTRGMKNAVSVSEENDRTIF